MGSCTKNGSRQPSAPLEVIKHMPHHAQAKAKAAKENAAYDLCLSNLRGDSRLAWKEEIAAKKAARDPRRVLRRYVEYKEYGPL